MSLEAAVGCLIVSSCGSHGEVRFCVSTGSCPLGIARDVAVQSWGDASTHDAITGAATVSLSLVSKLEA